MLAAPTPLVLLKLPTVKTRVGLNKTAIYAGIKAGWFPKPVKIGAASRWVESEIDALIVKLTERRDHGKA
ncbi:AlpA family phage regulatory protein [Luteimonas panaciterrae]|uniref:helix-turn-helix transcriptional regulator n=1 Tax=Luteimonas panaciterrae TaxID=363885 RepID=UPI001CF92FF3